MTSTALPESTPPGSLPHVLRHNVLRQTATVRRAEDGVEVEVMLEDLVEKRAD